MINFKPMKNSCCLFIGLLLLLVSCHQTEMKSQSNAIPQSKNIKETLQFLASDDLKGRAIGSEGIEKAAQFIEQHFKQNRLEPFYETYRDSFPHNDLTGYNLIALKKGTDPVLQQEFIVLSAHYDHIGILKAVEGDSIANGANDDASGTAAVLELARYFAHHPTKRSLLFVLFSGEESGLIGSTHLAKRFKKEQVPVSWMLNLEMLGVSTPDVEEPVYLTGFHFSDLANQLNHTSSEDWVGYFEGEEYGNLFMRSDNYAFYKHLNIPAHTLSSFTFSNFKPYHQVGDEVDLIDFDFMENITRKIAEGVEELANEKEATIQLK